MKLHGDCRRIHIFMLIVTNLFLSLFFASCGANEISNQCANSTTAKQSEAREVACTSTDSQSNGDAYGKTSDDRADESKPPFVILPGETSPTVSPTTTPNVDTDEPTPVPTATVGGSGGGYGVNEDMSCEAYVEKFWKVGALTYEEAPGPLMTKLKFTTKVLSVDGTKVTINTKLETPDTSKNLDETLSFDACTEGYLTAVPKTKSACNPKLLGAEKISVGGKSYNAKKYEFSNCVTTDDKTFSSTVWRAAEIPLWGVLKREVSGTVVPSELNGKISAESKRWQFE